ncbi:hypothetical protein C8J57DRAFT_1536673 [Mycena rebaudengoi]|nr:hypothetical protein C8J57DRAFT_1536673 [Mycena rebaudengoi]
MRPYVAFLPKSSLTYSHFTPRHSRPRPFPTRPLCEFEAELDRLPNVRLLTLSRVCGLRPANPALWYTKSQQRTLEHLNAPPLQFQAAVWEIPAVMTCGYSNYHL